MKSREVSTSLQGPSAEGANSGNARQDWSGAGDGNRTRTTSLEGWSSTIELLPQRVERDDGLVGGEGFEPSKASAS